MAGFKLDRYPAAVGRIASCWRNWAEAERRLAGLALGGPQDTGRLAHEDRLASNDFHSFAGKWPDSASYPVATVDLDEKELARGEPD